MAKLKIDTARQIHGLNILTKGLVRGGFLGNYRSVFKGKGLEFESFRDYHPGDDSSLIDWETSKRVGKLLVKEFVEERNMDVFFLVDISSNMLVSSTKKLKSEYIAELVSTIALSVLSIGDNIGFALLSNSIVKEVPLSKKMSQFHILTNYLVNPEHYGGFFNLNAGLLYIMNHIKKDALIFIVSDFISPFGWEENLKFVCKKFDVIGIMVRDPRDLTLPDTGGEVALADPYTKEKIIIDPRKIKKEYEMEVKKQTEYIKGQFLDTNSDFLHLITNKDFFGPLL